MALTLLISRLPDAFHASTLRIANAAIILAYEQHARASGRPLQPRGIIISEVIRLKNHVEELYSSLCPQGPRIRIANPRLLLDESAETTFQAGVAVHDLGRRRDFTFHDAPSFLTQLVYELLTPQPNQSQNANVSAANAAVMGEPPSWSCTLL